MHQTEHLLIEIIEKRRTVPKNFSFQKRLYLVNLKQTQYHEIFKMKNVLHLVTFKKYLCYHFVYFVANVIGLIS